jgi:hypothetical protein
MLSPRSPRILSTLTRKSTRLEIAAHILKCFELESLERQTGIANIMAMDGKDTRNTTSYIFGNDFPKDIMEATLQYDEQAPHVTNVEMLSHCDIHIDNTSVDDLPFILNCLAGINVFVSSHEHLTDQELWDHLQHAINEETPFLPPSEGVNEFINFALEAAEDPDYKSLRTVPAPLTSITDVVIEEHNTKDTQ